MGGAWGSPLYRTEVHSLTRSRAHAHGHRLCPTKEKDLPSKNRCEEREKTLRRPHAAYQHTRYTVYAYEIHSPHPSPARHRVALQGDRNHGRHHRHLRTSQLIARGACHNYQHEQAHHVRLPISDDGVNGAVPAYEPQVAQAKGKDLSE